MMELVDIADLKSAALKGVPVRLRLEAPILGCFQQVKNFYCKKEKLHPVDFMEKCPRGRRERFAKPSYCQTQYPGFESLFLRQFKI